MVEKLSSVRIITAASLVTSVPVPIAIPISAFFTAGASLTPSPVMATIWPFFLRTSTRRTLCHLAVPPHPGLDDHHLLQGGDSRGGLPLLMHALDRVEERQQDQQHARAELL